MAGTNAVWGIDIGQCALKALRCSKEGDVVVADGFDYIEYPKILSQPEAEPTVLVREALEQFLSRNNVKDCKVAMSVPGQSGLAKFFKPPPVDAKRIPEIVKYEAKQQIPFDLDDVIWDFQQMKGGAEVDGFALEAEVGLFAMKREQVFRAIKPFEDVDIELDIVQLAPISIFNFVAFDLLTDGPAPDEFDPDDPPPSVVILAMGTETTDLVVTNGFRLWQRSIPIGGNHFTKQLTKDLKLTFAKAEHLKRNARQAEDPKAVFQAMRPIFNDMVTEVQRSIGYFQGIDRKAKIGGVVLLGNTVKLPGLQQYLAKNLGYEVVNFDNFKKLAGSSTVTSPAFRDNLKAFGVSYGLCLQGLGEGKLSTNLVPREIIINRLIREKKPWALASVAALMLACAFNFFFHFSSWHKVQPDTVVENITWQDAETQVQSASSTSSDHEKKHADRLTSLKRLTSIGEELVGNADRRLLWMELLEAINLALPHDQTHPPNTYISPKDWPYDERPDINIEYIESQHFPDLATWFTDKIKQKHIEVLTGGELSQTTAEEVEPDAADPAKADPANPMPGDTPPENAAPPVDNSAAEANEKAKAAGIDVTKITGPTGEGWVIEIKAYHFFNKRSQLDKGGANHVRNTLIKFLEQGSIELPISPNTGETAVFTMKELGIGYAVMIDNPPPDFEHVEPNPAFEKAGGSGGGESLGPGDSLGADPSGIGGSEPASDNNEPKEKSDEPAFFPAPKFSFTVQFSWQEKLLSERLKERAEKAKGPANQNEVAVNLGSGS